MLIKCGNFTFILNPYNDAEISLMLRNGKPDFLFCQGCHKREA